MKFLSGLTSAIAQIGAITLWFWAIAIAWKFGWFAFIATCSIPFAPIIYWAFRLSFVNDGHIYFAPYTISAAVCVVIFGLSCLASFLSSQSE